MHKDLEKQKILCLLKKETDPQRNLGIFTIKKFFKYICDNRKFFIIIRF